MLRSEENLHSRFFHANPITFWRNQFQIRRNILSILHGIFQEIYKIFRDFPLINGSKKICEFWLWLCFNFIKKYFDAKHQLDGRILKQLFVQKSKIFDVIINFFNPFVVLIFPEYYQIKEKKQNKCKYVVPSGH